MQHCFAMFPIINTLTISVGILLYLYVITNNYLLELKKII